MTRIVQGLLWIARRCAEAIRWAARTLETLAERIEHAAESFVEIAQECVHGVVESDVGKTIISGYDKCEKLVRASEFLSGIGRITSWVVTFLLGQTCSTIKAEAWTSFAACAGAYTVTFIGMTAGSILFLYLIGQLTQLRL